jgi:DNA-binding NarL/FixJ family response regulator
MIIKTHEEIAVMSIPKHNQVTTSKSMKVLLVEDSILIRNTLIEILNSNSNLTVNGMAGTQNSAIALLDEQQFDMLLVDIELAEGNGFEVIRHTLR